MDTIKIRKIRVAHGLTQTDLSKKAKVAQSTLSEIERGVSSPRLITLRKITEALGVDLKDVIDIDSKEGRKAP